MKKRPSKGLTQKQQSELSRLSRFPEEEIDTHDIPEVPDWSGAKRGLFYRPVKKQMTLRIDADVLAWFRNRVPRGRGYQTAMNDALRQYMQRRLRHRKAG